MAGKKQIVILEYSFMTIEIRRQGGIVVADRRKTQKNHIRAARDWLGQAEHLLDHENDIQGDLKLMLARAELSKVQESPRGRWFRCWWLRLVPAVLALFIAAGGWLFWQHWQRPDVPVTANEPVLAGSHNPVEESSPPRATGPSVQQAQPDTKTSASASALPASQPATLITVPESSAVLPHVSAAQPAVTPVPTPPTPATQKLMQSAGKILRQ